MNTQTQLIGKFYPKGIHVKINNLGYFEQQIRHEQSDEVMVIRFKSKTATVSPKPMVLVNQKEPDHILHESTNRDHLELCAVESLFQTVNENSMSLQTH